jgi:hypothetical protein
MALSAHASRKYSTIFLSFESRGKFDALNDCTSAGMVLIRLMSDRHYSLGSLRTFPWLQSDNTRQKYIDGNRRTQLARKGLLHHDYLF